MTLKVEHKRQLESRGILAETALAAGIVSSKEYGGSAICIPYYREGKVVNRKFRTLDVKRKFWQDDNGVQCFWNEDILRDESLYLDDLIICEGEMDGLVFQQCGYRRVVSVPGGAPSKSLDVAQSPQKYKWLEEAIERFDMKNLKKFRRIILATDGDGPGLNLMRDLAEMLGRPRCLSLTYPLSRDGNKRLKDANDVYIEYGRGGIVKTLQKATFIHINGIVLLSEMPDLPPTPVFNIGYQGGLNNLLKIRLRDLWAVTGIPSHGKTSFVDDLVMRAAVNHNFGCAIAPFEQEIQTDLAGAMRAWYYGHENRDRSVSADQWIDEHFTFIVRDDDDDSSLDWFLEQAAAAVIRHGRDIIVIDPWNEMDHTRPRDISMTEYTGIALRRIKRFAQKFQVLFIIVAHPKKLGNGEIPSLYDISDSAHFANKIEAGVVVHREDQVNTIYVKKIRYQGVIGEPGEARMLFNRTTRRFYPEST